MGFPSFDYCVVIGDASNYRAPLPNCREGVSLRLSDMHLVNPAWRYI